MSLREPVIRQPGKTRINFNAAKTGGVVVVLPCNAHRNPRGHESVTHSEVARKLAALKGFEFGGDFDPLLRNGEPFYFVPSDTLTGIGLAQGLGIRGEQDLFGGVVPFPFVASKVITHGLFDPAAPAPAGWSADFAHRVQDVVLPGYSVFTLDDARNAGASLLKQGPVRLKPADGIGGRGQEVVANADELEAQLRQFDADAIARAGLVLEQNMSDVVTYSVGQVRVDNLLATYYGTQRLASNNRGEQVYGGSTLTVVRGDFDALLRLDLEPQAKMAIAQARCYHDAAMVSFPGMFASRCNYDIAQGVDAEGRWHSGVLEQSWRVGGASGAEVAALEAFSADPALAVVCASTVEVYGTLPALPPDSVVYFQGVDEHVGQLTKYSHIESCQLVTRR
jgi:hypothetical protein